MKRAIAFALAFCFLAFPAQAAIPRTLSYQGYLTTNSGTPVNGTVTVTFSIYTAASGGVPLWTETIAGITANGGVVNAVLGAGGTPLSLAFDVPYFLGISVDPDPEMTPRQSLTASPYAMRAAIADTASAVSFPVPGAVPWVEVSGSSQQAASNRGYLVTGATLATITLPAAPAVGDVVKVSSPGGGFTLVPNSGQGIAAGGVVVNSWVPRESARSWRSIASSADGTKLAAVVDNGPIYTSADSGVTWTARLPVKIWRGIASSADGTKLVAVTQGDFIFTSVDSGATWTPREAMRGWYSIASSADGTKLAAGVGGLGPGQIYTSIDSGVSWTPRASSKTWYSIASSADGTKLAAITDNDQVFTSIDSGVTWTPRESVRFWRTITSSADGAKLAAIVGSGQIHTSVDSGVTWTARDSARNWTFIASSADGTKLAAVVGGGQIYTSLDSGTTWTARDVARNWFSLASSADGTRLATVVLGGQIFTGVIASLTGGTLSAAEVVYAGSGRWVLVSQQGTLF